MCVKTSMVKTDSAKSQTRAERNARYPFRNYFCFENYLLSLWITIEYICFESKWQVKEIYLEHRMEKNRKLVTLKYKQIGPSQVN